MRINALFPPHDFVNAGLEVWEPYHPAIGNTIPYFTRQGNSPPLTAEGVMRRLSKPRLLAISSV
jgi:hypothetical protein